MVQPSPSPAVVAVLWKGVTDARDQLAALIAPDTGDLRAFDAMRDKIDAMEEFVSALDTLHGDPAAAVSKAATSAVAAALSPSTPPTPPPLPPLSAAQTIAASLGLKTPPAVSDIASIDSINHL